MKNKKIIYTLLLIIILIGGFLRIYRLGSQSMWTDEVSGVIISQKDLVKIIKDYDDQPPLYYVLTHLFLKVYKSDFMARFPAAIFGILAIYIFFRVTNSMFNVKTGLIASFLLSISLYHIYYSQEARAYTTLIFFTVSSLYFLWQAVPNNKYNYWLGFICTTVLGLYSHYMFSFVLFTNVLIYFILFYIKYKKMDNKSFKAFITANYRFLLSMFVILILSILWIKGFRHLSSYRTGGESSIFKFNIDYLKNVLFRYGAGNGIPAYIYGFFFFLGMLFQFKKKKIEITALLLFLIIPFFVLSAMKSRYSFHIRYLMFTFPVFLIFVSRGISVLTDLKFLNKAIPITAIIIIIAAVAINPLRFYYRMPARLSDWRGLADYMKNNYRPDTVILIGSSENIKNVAHYYTDKLIAKKMIGIDGGEEKFEALCTENRNKRLWYIADTGGFDCCVEKYFQGKIEFTSDSFYELGKKSLIDWEPWTNMDVRGYRLALYYSL